MNMLQQLVGISLCMTCVISQAGLVKNVGDKLRGLPVTALVKSVTDFCYTSPFQPLFKEVYSNRGKACLAAGLCVGSYCTHKLHNNIYGHNKPSKNSTESKKLTYFGYSVLSVVSTIVVLDYYGLLSKQGAGILACGVRRGLYNLVRPCCRWVGTWLSKSAIF